jgi:ABC-2 type transport system ATP-binding protein
LPEKYGMTVLISSHLLSEIDQIATSVGVVSKGKLIFQGSIESMRQHAQQKVTMRVSHGERAWRSLIASGIKAEYSGNRLLLPDHSDESIAEAVRTLVQNGVSVYRIEEEKRSLEDVFLQMTGKEGIA